MKIDLGKYVITYDRRSFTLNKKSVIKIGKNTGQESLTPLHYYTQLSDLIPDVIRRGVEGNEIKTLQQLSELIEKNSEKSGSEDSAMITLNLTPETVNNINHQFESGLFVWQQRWKANQHHRNRFLHKCRQIGADYYFVLEALNDACRTGRNKFFLSNKEFLPFFVRYLAQYFPKQQAYLTENAEDIHRVRLSNGAEIRFVHENSYVAALCGDVYVSEWAWSDNPVQLVLLALSLSMHEKWHKTFYSSRCSGDNGEETYKRFFTLNRVFSESAFFDTVTLFDFAESRWSEERLRQNRSQQEFEELYLCRLPHERW